MEIQRCYDILELPFGASLAEVNDQWKTLAKIFLNDRAGFVPGTKEYEFALRKMQDINQAHAILKNWLEHSANSSSGSAPARRPKPQPPAADRKRQRSNPETERQGSNGRSKQALPLLYPPFQPNAMQTLIDKMENGNEFVRTALLLLAILLLFTPLLLFPLLATAMGEKPLRWLYSPAGVLLTLVGSFLWVLLGGGNLLAIRDELHVHRNRIPKGFRTAFSGDAWHRVEDAIAGIKYKAQSWIPEFPAKDFADGSAKCVYQFKLPYRFLWFRFSSQLTLTVKIKEFPSQNLALACYWFEKDKSNWWPLPPASVMKKTSVALISALRD